jgi:hypothetical protein
VVYTLTPDRSNQPFTRSYFLNLGSAQIHLRSFR